MLLCRRRQFWVFIPVYCVTKTFPKYSLTTFFGFLQSNANNIDYDVNTLLNFNTKRKKKRKAFRTCWIRGCVVTRSIAYACLITKRNLKAKENPSEWFDGPLWSFGKNEKIFIVEHLIMVSCFASEGDLSCKYLYSQPLPGLRGGIVRHLWNWKDAAGYLSRKCPH